MKGTIRENMGLSRYIVGVSAAQQPLQDEIKKYEALYEAASERLTEAKKVLGELRKVYWDALDVVAELAGDYEACRRNFSPTNCIATGIGACESAYSDADSACLDIESGPGTCDDDCQRERERCQAAADKAREACLAKVQIECSEAAYAHLVACQNTWSPKIAAAQAVAIELMPGVQEALYNRDHEQARQWQIARKLTELSGIEGRESQINCARAQWDDKLAVGAEVEMARTPNWRNVITGIVTAPTPCFHDARALPSGHLFVNASLAPGFETWRPTWRVGKVKEVIPPKLKIEFAAAIIHGSLGTVDSQNINCTPPQCYFDGVDPKAAEADIRAARTALMDAQQALVDAVALRAECIAVYDQAWMDRCYDDAVAICDQHYGTSMEQPTLDQGDCYTDAQGTCEEQTAAGLEGCSEAHQPDIDDAQSALDAATAILSAANDDLIAAQQALAAIEAEIQECVDAVNTQEWLDDERDRLTGLCAEAADDRKQECLDNGNTAAECQIVRDAIYADCVALIDEQLPLRQAAARDKCQDDRQADVDAAEIAIAAAFTAVNNAEIAMAPARSILEDALEALRECQADFVLGDCLASALQICDDTYDMAEDTAILQRAACYQEAMAECDRQRDEAIDACYAAHADAIAAAQTAVDEAARDVELATNGRYHPADPLILEVPVAHCGAGQYKVDDEVLIDFPVRSGETAMAVWDSRRVIGWAQNTRTCDCCGGIHYELNSPDLPWSLGRYRSDTPYFSYGDGVPPQTDCYECTDDGVVLSHTNTEYPYAWFIFGPQIIDEYTPCEFEVRGEISGEGEFYFNANAYTDQPGGINVIFTESFGWTRVCFGWVRTAPAFVLFGPFGSSVKVWVRHAKGNHDGFCEVSGASTEAMEEQYQALVAEVVRTEQERSVAQAALDACYESGVDDCTAIYPCSGCLWKCYTIDDDLEEAIYECIEECNATPDCEAEAAYSEAWTECMGACGGDPECIAACGPQPVNKYELFTECRIAAWAACDAELGGAVAAAVAADNAASDALAAFTAGVIC